MAFVACMDPHTGLVDRRAAQELGGDLQERYLQGDPFPHIMIDNFLPDSIARMFLDEFARLGERGDAAQQTDVVRLDAELLEVVTEGDRHIVSVRFSGLIREDADGQALPFDEVWHLSKPLAGDKGWVVAGIQQTN